MYKSDYMVVEKVTDSSLIVFRAVQYRLYLIACSKKISGQRWIERERSAHLINNKSRCLLEFINLLL